MLNAIIIDSDLKFAKLFKDKISKNLGNKLNVLNIYDSLFEISERINSQIIHVIFLNVKLKHESGFDLFKVFSGSPNFYTIFISSNMNLILESIKFRPIDFLIKPISSSDILRSFELLNKTILFSPPSFHHKKIIFPFNNGYKIENINNIVFCQASGSSTKIVTLNNNHFFICKTLKWISKSINNSTFFRIHKSFLININYVTFFNKSDGLVQLINGKHLPVSIRKVKDFYNLLSN